MAQDARSLPSLKLVVILFSHVEIIPISYCLSTCNECNIYNNALFCIISLSRRDQSLMRYNTLLQFSVNHTGGTWFYQYLKFVNLQEFHISINPLSYRHTNFKNSTQVYVDETNRSEAFSMLTSTYLSNELDN
jgi:hypothetical protein